MDNNRYFLVFYATPKGGGRCSVRRKDGKFINASEFEASRDCVITNILEIPKEDYQEFIRKPEQ